MRRIARRLLLVVALLILGFAGWCSYYVCNHGFSRHWRLRVSQEFRRRGLDLYVHRITLDPIHGFVARDVQIYDAADPSRVLATIDRVALDLNLTNLIHGKPFIDAVDLRNAGLSLPLDPDNPQSERVKVTDLNARIIFPPHEWYVSQAEATMYGIQVSARGRLLNPEDFHPAEPSAQRPAGPSRAEIALAILRQLETLRFGNVPPRIEISFGGDLADIDKVYADATVWGEDIRRSGGRIAQVYAALALRDRVIDLKQCNISDAHGELDLNGSLNLANSAARFDLRSTLGPSGIDRMLKMDNPLADWRFPTPPEIELSGSGVLGDHPSGMVIGHLALGRFSVKGAEFGGAGADFSWDGSRWYVRNGWIENRTGLARLRAISVPGSFRAQLDSGINPNSLRPLASGGLADALRDWDFQESPKASLSVTGSSLDPSTWETEGKVQLGRTAMRGVPLIWANANVDAKGMVFTYRDFTVQRDEGSATGSFTYDFGNHQAWLTNVHAHLNTTEAAVWINPDLPRQLAPYRFKTAPDVTLDGFIQCANDKGTHLDIHVNAPDGLDYTFCKRDLDFPSAGGEVLLLEHRIQLKDVTASLYGGTVTGEADIPMGRDNPGYTARIGVDRVDFASIAKLYFNYSDSHGLLSGSFGFGGQGDDPWTLDGKGMVDVTEGNVFAIPLLGPFSGILNSMVPGMGYNVANEGSSSFSIRDGIISTNDFLVKGRGFSMIGDGRLFFLDDRLNFNIRLNAQGLPGVLLFPVSKLLEYAGTGTLENPEWKPVLLEGKR